MSGLPRVTDGCIPVRFKKSNCELRHSSPLDRLDRMRSYGQYCALAKALDVIGDRWSLLIVRELILRDACRYTDLREGLPGIATNLLADRLRELESAGIVSREKAPPPVATTVFRLTERGLALRPAVHALGRWGAPLLGDDFGDESFRSHWIALPLEWT